jgi:hypothetical protein
MFLISGLRLTTGFYISEFKVDLAGNKRRIEFDMKWISQRLTYCLNYRYIAVAMPVLVMLWKLWIYFAGFKKKKMYFLCF